MKRILILSFSFLLIVSSNAQQLSKADEQFVDSIMNASYKPDGPGAVILIAKKGLPVFRKAYGLANLELNVNNKPDYVFRIGSMSKQFTAVCILKLAQEGKLSLQDDINKYLPDYNIHGRHITIENLLTHTSGITSYTEKKDFRPKMVIDQSKEDIMNYFMNDSLLFEPGTDWSYSNSGYVVAGLIVEKVSGISLNEYLQQNIFHPLRMFNTSIGSYDSIVLNSAFGYEAAGYGKFKPASYLSWSWPYAAGAIVTNVDDLLKWDNALYTDKIIKSEWLEKAWKPFLLPNGQLTNYGFGWSVGNYHGLKFITHGGAINGFLSDGIRIPSQQIYVTILSNSTSKSPSDFSSNIALRVAGQFVTTPSFVRIDKKVLENYTGVYAVHRSGKIISTNSTDEKMYRYLTIKDDTLFSQSKGESKNALVNITKDLFAFKSSNTYCKFHRNEKDKIVSLEIYSEPIQYGPSELEPKTDIPLPKEKLAVAIDVNKLGQLKGKYDFGGGFIIQVSLEGNKIYIQATGQEKEEIFAENQTNFFLKTVDATIEFLIVNGKVSGMFLNQGGKFEAKKIE